MPGPVQSVERAAAMIELLAAAEEPLALVQVSAALGLAKGTAHGLLRTLVDVGFVAQDPATTRYHVSANLLRLGSTQIDVNELRARALNWTDVLAARSGMAVGVAVFRDDKVVRAHHVLGGKRSRPVSTQSDQVPRSELTPALSASLPLHASALGKVLLAYEPGAVRTVAAAGRTLVSFTHHTITDRVLLQRDLANLRDRGWAADVEEQRAGWAGIAAPVRDRGGHVVASVGVEGPSSFVCDSRSRPLTSLVTLVQHTAQSISHELGHGRA